MAGWIKLWRKLLENGHLKMPGIAFKLWIYCLLEAAPYPDPKRDLSTGELWLSYQGIRENLAEGNRKVSMSTISAALKYLEQNRYITLQSEKFKGIKAKVLQWGEYQALTYTDTETVTETRTQISAPLRRTITHSPPAAAAADLNPSTAKTATAPSPYSPTPRSPNPCTISEPQPPSPPTIKESPAPTPYPSTKPDFPTTLTVVESNSPTTPRVAETPSPTTLQVADNYTQSSRPTTPSVVTRTPQPYSGKAPSSDKNTIKNSIKNINSVVVVTVAEEFMKEFGRPLSPLELKQITQWHQTFSEDLIKEALTRASLQDKRSIAYVGGILKNWSRAGITTVEETLQESSRSIPKGGKRNARSKPGYRPHEVDWANEPDTL